MRSGSRPVEAVVIGGGPAGSSLATALAAAGREVLLFEREAGPHDKVCGEFLSHEAMLALARLGIDLPALRSVPLTTMRLATAGADAVARLPFPACSLSRRTLDAALLQRARASGASVQEGVRVRALVRAGDGWQVRTPEGTIAARTVFLATGKHDLAGWPRPPGRPPDMLGFKMLWRLSQAQAATLAARVELMLFAHGYAGLEPVERGSATLCLAIRRPAFARLGGRWDELIGALTRCLPPLAERLAGGEPLWAKPLAIARLPYGHIRRASDGPWRLGDQAAVIPSLAGMGVAIALASGRLAARHYLAGDDAATFQRALAGVVGRPVGVATALSLAAVNPWAGRGFAAVLARAPAVLPWLARATRLPEDDRQTGRLCSRSVNCR
jgi:flavin-dependent dehydrogenase